MNSSQYRSQDRMLPPNAGQGAVFLAKVLTAVKMSVATITLFE